MKWLTVGILAAGLTACGPEAPADTLSRDEVTEFFSVVSAQSALVEDGEDPPVSRQPSPSTELSNPELWLNGSSPVRPTGEIRGLPQDPIPCLIVRPGPPVEQ